MDLIGRFFFTLALAVSIPLARAALIVIRHQIRCNVREAAIRRERYLSGANLTEYERWYGHNGTKAPIDVRVINVETLS